MCPQFQLNGLHLYSAFIQSTHIHTHIHTPTVIGCHARYQPAHQEQLGVRHLPQGTLSTHPVWDQTSNPPTARRLLLLPEPYRPQYYLELFGPCHSRPRLALRGYWRKIFLQTVKSTINNQPYNQTYTKVDHTWVDHTSCILPPHNNHT